ncbi:hypothetical protein GCM10022259_40550 [Aquimarina mytili]
MLVCQNSNANVLETLDSMFLSAIEKPLPCCISFSFANSGNTINEEYQIRNSQDLCKVDVNRNMDHVVFDDYTYHECNSYRIISYLSHNLEYLHKDIENEDIIRFNAALDKINEKICNAYSVRELVQSKTSDTAKMSYHGNWDMKLKGLQKVKMVKNFFPIDANDFEGFGIRLKI